MKRFFFFFSFFLLMGNALQAQIQNFTVTDLDGNSHTLYDYLGAGKTVLIHAMSTSDVSSYDTDWDYVQSGVLDSIYAQYGPNGTDQAMVFMIEADSLTNDDCLYDLPSCNQINSGGDWVSEVTYPIIGGEDGSSLADIFYYDVFGDATIYIIYPNLDYFEEWGLYDVETLEIYLQDNPAGLIGANNVSVSASFQDFNFVFCGEMTPFYKIQNWGTDDLTSVDVEFSVNGTVEQSFTWEGNLASYEIAELTLEPVSGLGEMQLEISVSNPNGNFDDNNTDNSDVRSVTAPHNTLENDFNLIVTNFFTEGSSILQILDANGAVVYEQAISDSSNNALVLDLNDINLLTNGCHELLIYDPDGYTIMDGELTITNNGMVIWNDWIWDSFSLPFYNTFDYDFGATAIAFLDENENGIFDEGEIPLSNQSFSLDASNEVSFTNLEGFTTFILEDNTDYVLSWQENSLWNSIGETAVSFSTTGADSDQTFYFPLTPVTSIVLQDLDLSSSITRCSEDINYWLTYANTGTTFNDGYIQLIPDELTTFLNASPSPDSTAGDTLYWFYQDLPPSNSEQILLQFEMPGIAEFGEEILGESIDFEANIETNEGGGVRKSILSSELVCSYDPNDKLVSPSGYGGEENNYTLLDNSLEYTVRFQNTGNATAIKVRISDEIDENLDMSTMRVVASSHEVKTTINTETRMANFFFNDIYLADSFSNEPASHGFVKYRILPNEGLSEETVINNTANIYFDSNPAVVTNTTNNTMVSELPDLAVISVSPLELDFGFIAVGETGNEVLTIQNPGDLDLYVNEILSESPIFSTEASDFVVPGGGEFAINVRFTPIENIPYLSNLVLNSNGGDFIVTVKGEGGIDSGINGLDWRLSVSPNPSNGIFELIWDDINAIRDGVVTIFDVNGKSILSQEMNGNQTQIDLSAQAKGVYFLSLQTNDSTITKKLIVQ